MAITKKALIRDPDVPIGQPAPMHIECGCGEKINVSSTENQCQCGAIYDRQGYVIEASAASRTEIAPKYS
jgi:hypothetical protein